jgi:hypothetical protein
MRFDSSRSQDASKFRGSNGLKQELELSLIKKMIGGCFWDYNVGHYPLKTFNK